MEEEQGQSKCLRGKIPKRIEGKRIVESQTGSGIEGTNALRQREKFRSQITLTQNFEVVDPLSSSFNVAIEESNNILIPRSLCLPYFCFSFSSDVLKVHNNVPGEINIPLSG